MFPKAIFLSKKHFYKSVLFRTYKNAVQPKIASSNEINLENDMLATLRPPLGPEPSTPTLAGQPRLPSSVPHHKIREEVFEKWRHTSKCDDKKWLKSSILW